MSSLEQQARDILADMGIDDAQQMTAGDLVPLANVLSEVARLRAAMAIDDHRTKKAGERVGLYSGCDTAEHMADKILALRAALAAAPRWVSVAERLPDADKRSADLLALMDNGRWWHALYDGRWLEYDAEMGEWVSVMSGVTHWLELPPAPEVTP